MEESNLIIVSFFFFFISISQDQTAMMWQWNIPSNSVEVLKTFRGHDRAVDSLGISKDNSHTLATGSWDTNIHLWKTGWSRLF